MAEIIEIDGQSERDADEPTVMPQRIKITRASDEGDKKILQKRLKDVEICVPIVYGTIAFWLGRKASETQSHKWTVYVRGATNEDIGVVIKRAVFQLHPSFENPVRVVESPPFEISECGWGEFEIAISLFFHNDVCEKQLDLYHHLKLYAEDESGPQSIKKPVVVETYNEIVFPDPSESFYARVQKHPAVIVPRLPVTLSLPSEDPNEKKGDIKDNPLSQWFINFSEADELLKLAAARQQVQAHIIKLRRQLSVIDGLPLQSWKPGSDTKGFILNLLCLMRWERTYVNKDGRLMWWCNGTSRYCFHSLNPAGQLRGSIGGTIMDMVCFLDPVAFSRK